MPLPSSMPFPVAAVAVLVSAQAAWADFNWCSLKDRSEPFGIAISQMITPGAEAKKIGYHGMQVTYASSATAAFAMDASKVPPSMTLGPFTVVQRHATDRDGTHMIVRGGQSLPVRFSDKDVAAKWSKGRSVSVEILADGKSRFKRDYPLTQVASEGAVNLNAAQGVPTVLWPEMAKGRTIAIVMKVGKDSETVTLDAAAYRQALDKGWKGVEAMDRDWRGKKCKSMFGE